MEVTDTSRRLNPSDLFSIEKALAVCAAPDGGTVAYICELADPETDEFQSSLWLVDLASLENRRIDLAGQTQFCAWTPDGTLIAVVQSEGAIKVVRVGDGDACGLIAQLPTVPDAIAVSPDGCQLALRMVVPAEKVTVALPTRPLHSEWSERAFYTERVDWRLDGLGAQDGYAQVFKLNLTTGQLDQLTDGMTPSGYFSAGLAWTNDASRILFVSNLRPDWHKQQFNTDIYVIEVSSRHISCLTTRYGVDVDPKPSPNGDWIAYRGFDDRKQFHGVPSLYLMREDGSGAFCLADVGQDIGSHIWAADGSGLYISYVRDGAHRLAYVGLDGTIQEIASDLSQADGFDVEPSLVGSASLTAVPGGVVAIIGSATDPCQLMEITRNGAQRKLTRLNEDALRGVALGHTENLRYLSADGTQLQAWVHYPPGYDPNQAYPLILNIHGGPDLSYGGQFSFRFQRYVAEGFVVVAPNYRGSLGTDMRVYETRRWDFPGDEYDDVMAAVDAVLLRSRIDLARLYVTGLSAGGLLTAWVIGKSDRFAAAVVQSPVINFASHSLTQDLYSSYVERSFSSFPWEDPASYWARSPLSLVGSVTTPTLVIQGDKDSRTPLSEGLQLYHALKLRDVPSALLILPGAAHVPVRPVQLIEEQQHMLRWFQNHIRVPEQCPLTDSDPSPF